jgi:bifunctional DNA-binding transcriptional regulator/antitoxin component of YhaV-PrlF toxin-antitoxin module
MQMRLVDESDVAEGNLALPESIRVRMGLRTGDIVDAQLETTEDAERLVLTVAKPKRFEGRIIADPLTGWPVLDFGLDAPELTHEQVREMLADFP